MVVVRRPWVSCGEMGMHGVALDEPWRPWVSYEVCGLHVGERVKVRYAWVSYKEGASCMWWPWWP